MPFVDKIARLKSLAIVGTAKNTGKTESLNYVLRRLAESYPTLSLALTSIGIDGERRDQVTQTDKPEITLREGTYFVTAEKYYRDKRVAAEVIDVDERYTTSMGAVVYGRTRGDGKLLIAGPSSTSGLKHVVDRLQRRHRVELTLIDGALSRLSLAAPTVAEGMILATGAAYSAQPELLLRRMVELHRLIELPVAQGPLPADALIDRERGLLVINKEGEVYDPGFESAILSKVWEDRAWLDRGSSLYVAGIVSDTLLERLRHEPRHERLIVRDFTRIFASGQSVNLYLSTGKQIETLQGTHLVAVTFNPLAPSGYRLDSERMCDKMAEALGVPVYDIRRL